MRTTMLDRGPRDSTVLPTMKCAQCNQDVHIRLIGQHQCAQQPAVPSLPQGLRQRELSSFFDAPKAAAHTAGPPAAQGRGAVESRMFPSAYKPSFHMSDEEASAADDFDFDSMLQNASRQQPAAHGDRAVSPDNGLVSPGPRKIPDFSPSSSSMSLSSLAAGPSPLEFPQIAGRTSPTANGFTIRHDGRPSPRNPPTEPMSAPAPASPQSPGYGYPGSGQTPARSHARPPAPAAGAPQASLMRTMAAGAVPLPAAPLRPPPLMRPGTYSPANSSPAGSTAALPTVSLPSSPHSASPGGAHGALSPPPLVRAWHRQDSDGAAVTPANNAAANNDASPRSVSSHREELHQRATPSPTRHNAPRSANPASRSAAASRPDHSESSSLPIGGMMRTPMAATQRKASGGTTPHQILAQLPPAGARPARSDGSHAAHVAASEHAAMDAHTRGEARAHPPLPPVNVDARICISTRRPSVEPGSATPSPRLPPSLSRSSSATQDAASQLPGPPGPGGILRAPTHPAPAGAGLATNPLDMLASLVQQKPPVPQINTQVGARNAKQHNAARAKAPPHVGARALPASGAKPPPAAARSLKSAKLDSLLDDLMGEMQALSAEVRPESDRESMVSTASAASPVDLHTAAGRDPASRSRLDSTVSSASSSSTLSVGGAHKRQHCASCGAAVAGSVVRSSGFRGSEVPAGAQAVEHQGRIYCVRDYRQMAQTCRGCGKLCESTAPRDALHALDAWWHRKCFNCQACHRPFPDKSFYVFEHLPYCRYDYHKLNRSLCAACHEPIEGPCAQVQEGRFHPECFACAHCAESLRDVYYTLDGRFFCERHVSQQKHQRPVNKRMTVIDNI
ncbi:hypothetical protein LPJ61_000677 [Coemansia biformis]|uniref:LIM zinc-binding domain-containing protein n=1 Tax=Coemansia biformis TaxID=1286918 RepID=A0A9W7YGA3_9FUNG|nr:hypothetical protein LPJ61_000677 [Coemansia biformis]